MPNAKYEARQEINPANDTASNGPKAEPKEPNMPCTAIPLDTLFILCEISVSPVG